VLLSTVKAFLFLRECLIFVSSSFTIDRKSEAICMFAFVAPALYGGFPVVCLMFGLVLTLEIN
jgi:hypothetical protein